jgi:hypothetical protein
MIDIYTAVDIQVPDENTRENLWLLLFLDAIVHFYSVYLFVLSKI